MRILTILKQKPKVHKPMTFGSGSTERCRMNFTLLHSEKRFTTQSKIAGDIDVWLDYYNNHRPHSGKYCFGKTPMQTWNNSLYLAKEKLLSNQFQNLLSLTVSDQTKTGSGGNQPARDSLTNWNGPKRQMSPSVKLSFQEKMHWKTHRLDRGKNAFLSDQVLTIEVYNP